MVGVPGSRIAQVGRIAKRENEKIRLSRRIFSTSTGLGESHANVGPALIVALVGRGAKGSGEGFAGFAVVVVIEFVDVAKAKGGAVVIDGLGGGLGVEVRAVIGVTITDVE